MKERKPGELPGSGGRTCTSKAHDWTPSVWVCVHEFTGRDQMLSKLRLLTGLFQDAAQGTLDFGQKPCAHLLKLTPGKTQSQVINSMQRRAGVSFFRWLIILIYLNESTHLFSLLDTSMSFMKHSMLSGRSEELALMSFLSFSHSW